MCRVSKVLPAAQASLLYRKPYCCHSFCDFSLKIRFVFSNHFLFVCFLKHTKRIFLYVYLLAGLSTLLSALVFGQSLMSPVIPSQAVRRKWPLRSAANAMDQLNLNFIYTVRLNLSIFDAFCWTDFWKGEASLRQQSVTFWGQNDSLQHLNSIQPESRFRVISPARLLSAELQENVLASSPPVMIDNQQSLKTKIKFASHPHWKPRKHFSCCPHHLTILWTSSVRFYLAWNTLKIDCDQNRSECCFYLTASPVQGLSRLHSCSWIQPWCISAPTPQEFSV